MFGRRIFPLLLALRHALCFATLATLYCCSLPHSAAQDFKLRLLGLPEELRRVHAAEVQVLVGAGKRLLVRRWVQQVLKGPP